MGRAANGAGSVYKTASGWRGSILLDGRRRYVSGATKTATSEKLQELKNQASNGFVQKGRSPRLEVWIQHWLDATAPLPDPEESKQAKRHAIKTDSDYRKIVRLYLPDWLGKIVLAKLTPEHLEEAYEDLAARRLSQSTIYQLHSIIRASLTLAVKRGHVPQNAAKNVISPPQPKATKIQTAFTRAEQRAIRCVLEEVRAGVRWVLALALGVRPGEALGIEWKHINFKDRSIRIEQQIQMIDGTLRLIPYVKSDVSVRDLPMPEYIHDLLLLWQQEQWIEMTEAGDLWADWQPDGQPHAFVFTSRKRPGMPLTPGGDDTNWRRILERAHVADASPYKARHTAASEMIASGIDITVVAEIMGHSVKVLQKTYAHPIAERKRAAATVLDFAFEANFRAIDAKTDAPTKKTPAPGEVRGS